MKITGVAFVFLVLSSALYGQVASIAPGDWDNPAIWSPAIVPDASSGTITVNHAVTVRSGFSYNLDETTIASGGQLIVQGTVTIQNGSGTDLAITGTGLLTVQTGGVFAKGDLATTTGHTTGNTSFTSGSTYQHLYTSTEGSIPIATWNANSLVEIVGYNNTIVATAAGNWSQNFGNVTINCANLNNRGFLLQGLLTTTQGNLSILKTGSNGWVELTRGQTGTLNITGDLTVSNDARVYFTSTGTITVNAGDFFYNSTNMNSSYLVTTAGSATLNIRDFSMNASGGVLRIGSGTSTGVATLNITRNFTLTTGKIEEVGTASIGTINFTGTNQAFSSNGQITGTVNYNVNSGTSLNLGTSAVTGSGNFTLNAGATLTVASTAAAGSIAPTAANGNIQLPPANRIFNTPSTIVYGGTSPQNIGTGHPSGTGITTRFSNSSVSGVTLLANMTFDGPVVLQSGLLSMSTFNITMSGATWTTNGGTLSSGASNVVNFSGTTLVSGSVTPVFRNVSILNGANVSISSADIVIQGNLTIQSSAAFTHNGNEVRFTAGSNQTIDANGVDLFDVRINKTAGIVTLSSGLDILNVLTIQTATQVNTNNFLTLISTSESTVGTGSIGPLATGAIINGNVTVQRFLGDFSAVPLASRYRYLSVPISNATVADWKDDFAITGTFADPSPIAPTTRKSLLYYNEAWGSWSYNGWEPYPASGLASANPLVVGRGYSALMLEPGNRVVDVTGSINRGNINLPVIRTDHPGFASEDGWNLVGNPYPSAILWDLNGSGWSYTNIAPTIAFVDNRAGIYKYWNGLTGTGDADFGGVIALGQSFWVYANATSPSLTVREAAKTTNVGTLYRKAQPQQLVIELTHNSVTDRAYLTIQEDATEDFDKAYDIFKIPNPEFGVGIMNNKSQIFAISAENTTELYADTFERKLSIAFTEKGKYTLDFRNSAVIPVPLFLYDRYLDKVTKLPDSYSFDIDDNVGSYQNRFMLTTRNSTPEKGSQLNVLQAYPNPTRDVIEVRVQTSECGTPTAQMINAVGQEVLSAKLVPLSAGHYGATININSFNAGAYLLRIRGCKTPLVERVLKN